MTLKVLDFRTKDKMITNRYHNVMMANAYFIIFIEVCGKFKEFAVQVPKRYHYERTLGYGNFLSSKVNEYNVLVDFIRNNEAHIKDKWHLSQEELEELLDGIKLCLIQEYSTCSKFKSFLLSLPIFIAALLRIVRRIK